MSTNNIACEGKDGRCVGQTTLPPSYAECHKIWKPQPLTGQSVTLTPHPLLVLWSRKGRAISLLPLWAVRPVQSLSACTRVHFTFTLPTSCNPQSLSRSVQGLLN